MIITVDNSKLPKVKHSDILNVAGAISEVIMNIALGTGMDMTMLPIQILYASSFLTKTGASVVERWEQQNGTIGNDNIREGKTNDEYASNY